MPSWLVEFISVLAYSKKTQWAIIWGIVFFIGINIAGSFILSNSQGDGILNAISEKYARKYDKVAFIALFSFLAIAVKSYRRDRKKFFML